MLETRRHAETGLRWYSTIISYHRESEEARNRDNHRWLDGSRIKHSTLRLGEPATWERS